MGMGELFSETRIGLFEAANVLDSRTSRIGGT